MFEFLSSPFGLVAVGLGVLAVAVLALCFWITTLDRRMRGMADGLEAERRKVAEMQMVIGRRNNAARSYGGGRNRTAAQAPVAAPAREAAPSAAQAAPAQPAPAPAAAAAPRPARAPQPAPRPAAQPSVAPGVPPQDEVEAWVQGGVALGQQPIIMPDKKMSRKARRDAERAFAARAAAELEARQARRAQEAAAVQRAAAQPGARPYGAPAAARPMGNNVRPMRGNAIPRGAARPAAPATGVPVAPVAPMGRGRHAR